MKELIEVSHVSKRGTSLRITIPRKVAEILRAKEESIVGFYIDGDKIIISQVR